jgi:uncharacterized oxidoreductase
MELVPPYVQTTLMGNQQAEDPKAMPLGEFIDEVMSILTNEPDKKEVCVKRVGPLRFAAEQGQQGYESFFNQFNDSMHK